MCVHSSFEVMDGASYLSTVLYSVLQYSRTIVQSQGTIDHSHIENRIFVVEKFLVVATEQPVLFLAFGLLKRRLGVIDEACCKKNANTVLQSTYSTVL
jgi:hypothetical protein